LFHLNVIQAVLHRRDPHFTDSARLWALAETAQIEGLVAAHSFTTLFYLYRRQADSQGAYQALRSMLRVFAVAGVDRVTIERACDLGWRDFKDAVQLISASGSTCDYLVTRNPGDYPVQTVTVVQPAEFLAVWAARQPGGN
jgi:predicted nucleic acid-binding protein